MHLKADKVCSSKDETYCYFNKYCNTRYIFPTEWICEFDIDHDTAILACCATIVNLLNQGYQFSVWYAEGMRSPHIHIYDLLPEDIDKRKQVLLRKKFAEKIIPKEYFKYVDKALFNNHKVCLEFAKHWKYGTHLKLLFEIPCS